jgi:hypothetical protein
MKFGKAGVKATARAFCVLTLICSAFASLPVFSFDRANAADLVFCPLQRQWVKRQPLAPAKPTESLSDVCAADRDKAAFADRLILKAAGRSIADEAIVSLYFEFGAKGDAAFLDARSRSNSPEKPTSSFSKKEIGSSSVRSDLAVVKNEPLALRRISGASKEIAVRSSWDRPLRDLTAIPSSTRPRAPPASL